MKKIDALFLSFLLLPLMVSAQVEETPFPKNTIMATPLMGLIGDSKPSIYYKRLLYADGEKHFHLRAGTDLFSSITEDVNKGFLKDFAANRFVTLEYSF